MTVSKLIKELEKIKDKHGPRTQVVVCKEGMKNLDNPDWSHIGLESIQIDSINWYIDDSCELKDGSERSRIVAVLNGE